MFAHIKRMALVIPEKTIEQELPLFHDYMREYAVRTYLIKKPEILDNNLELLGINASFDKRNDDGKVEKSGEADLIFGRHKTYYLVETKWNFQFKEGWEQILKASECFISEMKVKRLRYGEVIAVVVSTDPSAKVLKKKGPITLEELLEKFRKGQLVLEEANELGIADMIQGELFVL